MAQIAYFERSSVAVVEFYLSLISLYIIIKNLEEDIGFILVMLVQDIIKLKILSQKLLMGWKNRPDLTKGNINRTI